MIPSIPRQMSEIPAYCAEINHLINRLEENIRSAKASGVADKDIVIKYLSFSAMGGGDDICASLKILQHTCPALFAAVEVQNSVKKINSLFFENEQNFPIKTPFTINRPIEEFKGDKLVIGCGHETNKNVQQCAGHEWDSTYLVDISEQTRPDMVADYNSVSFWHQFANETFAEVYVEGFTPDYNENSLKEIARILKPEGLFRTGYNKTYEGLDHFNELGFSRFDIVEETLHTIGRIADFTMVHLTK